MPPTPPTPTISTQGKDRSSRQPSFASPTSEVSSIASEDYERPTRKRLNINTSIDSSASLDESTQDFNSRSEPLTPTTESLLCDESDALETTPNRAATGSHLYNEQERVVLTELGKFLKDIVSLAQRRSDAAFHQSRSTVGLSSPVRQPKK